MRHKLCSGTHQRGRRAGLPCRFKGKFVGRILTGIAAGQYTRLCGNHMRGALRSGKVELV